MRDSVLVATLACWLALGVASCAGDPSHYYGPFAAGIQVVGDPTDTPCAVMTIDGCYYEVRTRWEIPVAQPADAVVSGLWATAPVPWTRAPWIGRFDFELEVDYTLTNLSTDAVNVRVLFDAYNEFVEYVPMSFVDGNQTFIRLSLAERLVHLDALERRTAVLTDGDLDEAEVDLATIFNMPPTAYCSYEHALYFENSSTDPNNQLDQRYIPEIVPGLTGISLGLRTLGTAHVAIEYTVRVRDNGRKLWTDPAQPQWSSGSDYTPAIFSPAAMMCP